MIEFAQELVMFGASSSSQGKYIQEPNDEICKK
jgi:hypothetical protein